MRRNLYDLLGVRPDDDAETLRKAFLKAVKESHPDYHGDDPEAAERFREITEAYEILRDAGRRAAYDRLLEAQRRPIRASFSSAFSDVKRHMVTDAIIGVILAAMLVVGYELYSRMSQTAAIDEGAQRKAGGVTERADIRPVPQGGAAERSKPAAASALQPPAGKPAAPGDAAPARQTIEVARSDVHKGGGSDVPAGYAGAKAGPDDAAKNRSDEPQDRRDAPSARIGAPGSASPDAASPPNKSGIQTPERAGAGIPKPPAKTAGRGVSAPLRAAMKRPPERHAPFRHASLARRYGPAPRVRAVYCEEDAVYCEEDEDGDFPPVELPPFDDRY